VYDLNDTNDKHVICRIPDLTKCHTSCVHTSVRGWGSKVRGVTTVPFWVMAQSFLDR